MAKATPTTTALAGDKPKTTEQLCDDMEFQQGLVRSVFTAIDVLLHDNEGHLDERYEVKSAIFALSIIGAQMIDGLDDRIVEIRNRHKEADRPKAAAA